MAAAGRLNLVTGACGFSGSHLVKELLDKGQKVIASDLPRAFDDERSKRIFQANGVDFSHPNCEVVPADLTRKESLKPLFKKPATHIFHAASLYDYSAPMDLLKKINIDGFNNLIEYVLQTDRLERFVHWSTCGVFGKPHTAKEGPACNLPFSEEHGHTPRNTPFELDAPPDNHLVNDYSVTKWKQEQIAWKLHREKELPLTVVRPAPIYGPGSDYGHGGIIVAINKGLVPFIPADARNFITTSVHVKDIVGFSAYIADQEVGLGQDYNVVDDSIISYYDFLHYIALLLGRRLRDLPLFRQNWLRPVMIAAANVWKLLEEKLGVPKVRVLEANSATYMASSYWISNRKTKEAGYVYRYGDVREGLRDTVEWFRAMGWLDKSYQPKGSWKFD